MTGLFYLSQTSKSLAAQEGQDRTAANYALTCLEAATSDIAFASFKRNPRYTEILEHGSKSEGDGYLGLLRRNPRVSSWFLSPRMLEAFRENDHHGSPVLHDYGSQIGHMSVSTLRYMHDAASLYLTFGPLDGLRVAEIGGGYGGLAKIVTDAFAVSSYTIFDLPPALELVKRYVSATRPRSPVVIRNTLKPIPAAVSAGAKQRRNLHREKGEEREEEQEGQEEPFDLVISNFALSELSEEVQELYAHRLLVPARRIFLTLNSPAEPIHRILGESVAHRVSLKDAEPYVPGRGFKAIAKTSSRDATRRGHRIRTLVSSQVDGGDELSVF
eukprot:g176.t1